MSMDNINSLGATKHSGTLTYLLILGALFFIFGFVTWLNGALIPFLQIACELSHIQAYLVTMFFISPIQLWRFLYQALYSVLATKKACLTVLP